MRAALRHQIDDSRRYEAMVDAGTIRQAPAGTDADYFIFKELAELFPEARERVIRYMIVNQEVVFERRSQRRG